MLYAKIIPSLRLKRSLGVFDYLVPKELEKKISIGDLVEIYFRNKKTNGIVKALNKKSDVKKEKIKTINKLIASNFLDKNLLEMIDWLNKEYYISKPLALKTILPPVSKKLTK